MRRIVPLVLLLLAVPAVQADVKPHALFSNGMVLQQGVKCPVWGTADAGEKVSVSLESGDGGSGIKSEPVAAGQDGSWRIELPSQKAGGPYTLTIKGKNTITIKDVLFGEVWVASGQSNMWWTVNLSETPDKVKAAADHPHIRLFT